MSNANATFIFRHFFQKTYNQFSSLQRVSADRIIAVKQRGHTDTQTLSGRLAVLT